MVFLLIIVFAFSLIYLAVSSKLSVYIRILGLQGIVLFGIAFIELKDINIANLIFILAETIIVKSILVPMVMERVRRRYEDSERDARSNFSVLPVIAVIAAVAFSFVLSHSIHESHIEAKYFAISVAALITGTLLIIIRKRMLVHFAGYVVIENGIFLLAIAVGGEMPMLVNSAILLDVFASILVLGIFLNKVGDYAGTGLHSDEFKELKD